MHSVALSRRSLLAGCAAISASVISPVLARAEETYASRDQAKALAENAAALVREKGLDAAMVEFAKNPGPFRDRDLYVWIYRRNGDCVFNGASPAMVGRNWIDLKDVTGFPLVRSLVAVKDTSWVDYHWANPVTKKIGGKSSYVVGFEDFVLGVGAYKED